MTDLTPIVVQDACTGRVLMLAYGSEESIRLTEETGFVHFWSRSRRSLWKKGETSGNTLRLVDMTPDCDGDALLVRAIPDGPACHTGAVSCFDGAPGAAWTVLAGLQRTIDERARTRPEGSYTATLFEGGVDVTSRKVIEEAAEVAFAAKDHASGSGADDRVAEEAADLLYHLLVLLAERNVAPETVAAVLDGRAS